MNVEDEYSNRQVEIITELLFPRNSMELVGNDEKMGEKVGFRA